MPKMMNLAGMLLTGGQTTISASDFSELVTIMQTQVSVQTVVGVIASILAVCVGFAFFWWAIRKVLKMLMSAFKKGNVSV